ncbi:hypothetical protein HGM15179_004524 [Zosterops borbonicus]|uniref:Uncharacterized protein n=1 Tax=Zosterops borbonicus TaxID=364589 RepID=A0A8K1GSB7_9PASS|nr:hypothetical protein HGM15179_004524 [Zosterops borbonicus]
MGTAPRLPELQEGLDNAPRDGIIVVSVQDQDSMILEGLFQFRIFFESEMLKKIPISETDSSSLANQNQISNSNNHIPLSQVLQKSFHNNHLVNDIFTIHGAKAEGFSGDLGVTLKSPDRFGRIE